MSTSIALLILRNGIVTIGLFQGLFERNILTFNPGYATVVAFSTRTLNRW